MNNPIAIVCAPADHGIRVRLPQHGARQLAGAADIETKLSFRNQLNIRI